MSRRARHQLALAEAWKHPEGTPVTVRKDDGSLFHTKTRSKPWMLGASSHDPGHTAVILVEGVSGAYLLERVTVKEPA